MAGLTQVWLPPQCDADPPGEGRCREGAVWRIRLHSTDEPHAPDDTVWRVLCKAHAIEWLTWIQTMQAADDYTWCNICGSQIPPSSWLVEEQCIDPDTDPIGWVEWLATQQGEQ